MYSEKPVRQSETLQIILLDSLYSQSRSERILFQGGTALRWVYGGARFSEDLDFVTELDPLHIDKLIDQAHRRASNGCIVQFGPGHYESKKERSRPQSRKNLIIFRPENQRERIAVKLEFEVLRAGLRPSFDRHVLTDLPPVGGLIKGGHLIMPYSSSILLVETVEEILSDKVRALFERTYIKGRDIYDIWWIVDRFNPGIQLKSFEEKCKLYQAPFKPARPVDFFFTEASAAQMRDAVYADLARFLPRKMFDFYRQEGFRRFIHAVINIIESLKRQGLNSDVLNHIAESG